MSLAAILALAIASSTPGGRGTGELKLRGVTPRTIYAKGTPRRTREPRPCVEPSPTRPIFEIGLPYSDKPGSILGRRVYHLKGADRRRAIECGYAR